MKHLFIIISLLTLSLSAAAAEEVDSLQLDTLKVDESQAATPSVRSIWDSANSDYINGDFSSAIEGYIAIEEQGLFSDKLYFNLANAYYKSDDLARAILYYQKALMISPNDKDIVYNLSVAQGQIKDQIDEIPELFFSKWVNSISHIFNCTGWTILSLIALIIALTSALLFLLSSSLTLRKSGFGIGLLAAILCVVSTIYAHGERNEILNHNRGVIMSSSIAIKSSPDRSATDIFMLHSGTTVKIRREMDDWYEIVIADGKTGWIESKRVEQI